MQLIVCTLDGDSIATNREAIVNSVTPGASNSFVFRIVKSIYVTGLNS